MATPADLEDLAYGFALTEGLVESAAEIGSVDIRAVDEGFEALLAIPAERAAALASRRRAFAARTSCSLCGLEDLDMLLARRPAPAARRVAFDPEALLRAMAALPTAQRLNAETHAVHAAGWVGPDGAISDVREDVGRHNALDKLIGARLRAGSELAGGAVCLTSRCSIEMVMKAAAAGVGLIAAASSPTEMAVRAAEAAGIVLAAGVRDGALDVYACGDRLEAAA